MVEFTFEDLTLTVTCDNYTDRAPIDELGKGIVISPLPPSMSEGDRKAICEAHKSYRELIMILGRRPGNEKTTIVLRGKREGKSGSYQFQAEVLSSPQIIIRSPDLSLAHGEVVSFLGAY